MPTLEGTVERIVFASDNDAYTVVKLRTTDGGPWQATAVGHMPGVQEGQNLRLGGEWVDDARWGRQFRVGTYSVAVPATSDGIERYLASGLIPGVGPVLARRLVERFGERTLEVIRDYPDQLVLVDGIGARRADDIQRAWRNQHGLQEAMIGLTSLGISASLAARIVQVYGDRAVSVARQDPYRLAEDVRGIGFKTADAIAIDQGVARDSPRRAQAGLIHVLRQAMDDGHLYLGRDALLSRGEGMLGVDRVVLEDAIVALQAARRVTVEEGADGTGVYLASLFQTECALARGVRRLADTPLSFGEAELASALHEAEERLSLDLAPRQRDAVRAVLEKRVVVITGGPGTGKTTVVRSICAALRTQGARISLCAPTGRAAKRLAEATGLRAATIHRTLMYDPRTLEFQRDSDTPLEADAVIVDEASMLDVELALALVEAVPLSARLVLVGDVDQLPPVGPGSVLQHLIESGLPKVIRLDTIFRQGQESLIITNAHHILAGQVPMSAPPGGHGDFYIISRSETAGVLDVLQRLFTSRLRDAFGLDPIEDVQVLTPMHRGDLGAAHLNQLFQDWLNPNGREVMRGQRRYREGDKVMQVRNNYEKDVFNGDLGRVERVMPTEGAMTVRFDDRSVLYEANDIDEIELAYAVTVHKSQGSEYPAIVVPLHTQHYVMLRRNLLYTAVTRARKLAVIVGSEKAVQLAVDRNEASTRASRLRERLKGEAPC